MKCIALLWRMNNNIKVDCWYVSVGRIIGVGVLLVALLVLCSCSSQTVYIPPGQVNGDQIDNLYIMDNYFVYITAAGDIYKNDNGKIQLLASIDEYHYSVTMSEDYIFYLDQNRELEIISLLESEKSNFIPDDSPALLDQFAAIKWTGDELLCIRCLPRESAKPLLTACTILTDGSYSNIGETVELHFAVNGTMQIHIDGDNYYYYSVTDSLIVEGKLT